MDQGLSLQLFDLDGVYKEDFTHMVTDVTAEHLEGPFQLSLEMSGDTNLLQQWYAEHMMMQVRLFASSGEEWRGNIYGMTLEQGNESLVRDMAEFSNAVKCRYSNGTTVIYTGWKIDEDGTATTTESLDRYGRLEMVVSIAGNSSSEAIERAKAELSYRNTDKPTTWTYRDGEQNRLSIICVGNMVLANRIYMLENTLRYAESGSGLDYGETTTVSAEILRIVNMVNDVGGYLYPLAIDDGNELETTAGIVGEIGAYDRLLELSKLRDNDGNYYQLTVESDGGVIYEQVSELADFEKHPPPVGVVYPDKRIPKWDARPGFIRNMDSYSGVSIPGHWVSDSQLGYVERVVMRNGDERATFHSRAYDIGDYYRAIERNQRLLES